MADEGVRWDCLVGEYGVLLTEMGSMNDLLTPIKSSSRIKYTCMTASKKYIVLGSSTGGLYMFDRLKLNHVRFISNKDGAVNIVCFSTNRSLLGVATSLGIVLVWEVGSRHRDKPKFIRRSEEHKDTTVTALCWDEEEMRLFAGDEKGAVSVVHVSSTSKHSHSVNNPLNKGLVLLRPTQIVAKAQTPIVQLDCVGDHLLVSTMTKTAVVDLVSLDCVTVGVKPREGPYGSCFFKESNSESLVIYSARPGSRLWEASIDGQVMSTQQYKKLLATPPVPLLGYSHSGVKPPPEGSFPPQSVNFAKLLLIRNRYLVTWHGTSLYILDPILGQLVAWYALNTEVQDICCVGDEVYVYAAEGCVTWYALLSIKECTSRLYEMGEIKQCLQVLLDCKHYIIPGSARDMVPVSMVTSLRERLCEEESQDVITRLEELEHDLEPATVVSDKPPSYHGSASAIDSPDTVSMCSDVHTDDLEALATASDPGMAAGEEDDISLSMKHADDIKIGLPKKVRKPWSANVSLEGMLMSAAAAASKKFTKERQKGAKNLRRTQSADSPGSGRLPDNSSNEKTALESSEMSSAGQIQVVVHSDGSTIPHLDGQPPSEAWREIIEEEESPLIQRKELEPSPYHSDESEGLGIEEETSGKKDKLNLKEKRKKKKRVVTVDIDSPQFRQGQEVPLMKDVPLTRSSSFRGSYSAFGKTEVKHRRLSDPHNPSSGNIEITPAIPAMLSKAKGLLKKKLKSTDEDLCPSPTPPVEDNLTDTTQEESVVLKCPAEVEQLIWCSADTRNKVKSPVVLFSINSLRQALEDWIPRLHTAVNSCKELNKTAEYKGCDSSLGAFLDSTGLDDVSHLVRMCFDTAVYGKQHQQYFQEESCNKESDSEKSPDNSLLVDDSELSTHADILHEPALKMPCEVSRNGVAGSGHVPQTDMSCDPASNTASGVIEHGVAESGQSPHADISQSDVASIISCDVTEHVDAAENGHAPTADTSSLHKPTLEDLSMPSCVMSTVSLEDVTCVSVNSDITNLHAQAAVDGVPVDNRDKPFTQLPCVTENPPVTDAEKTDSLRKGEEDMTSPHEETLDTTDSSHNRHSESLSDGSVMLKQTETRNTDSVLGHELECHQCQTERAFLHGQGFARDVANTAAKSLQGNELDAARSSFLSRYFFLLDVKRVRRTLRMSRGDRRQTWRALVNCLQGLVTTDDVIVKYIKEGDTRRALHELHDAMELYSDTLLYHLTCLYESDRRETMVACARMFPDVHPWEVVELCRHCKSHSLETSSADFVFYVEQLMRWRAEAGNTKEQTVYQICEDMEITKWWFHSALIADSSRESLHCHCGLPRPGSHASPWQHADHLGRVIDFLQQGDPKESTMFMDLCWKHGYWMGLCRLYVWAGLRREALKLLVHLGDLRLIRDPQSWDPLPKFLDEWSHLLELLLSPCHHGNQPSDGQRMRTLPTVPDWVPDMTWDHVIHLMLERLGAGHTVNLLLAQSLDTPTLTKDFYYSCLLGAVVEKRQRTLIHELLKKLDSYLWSQRSGSLAPKLNMFRKEEQTSGPQSKEDSKPQLESMAHFRTLEDGASNWGQNIRLSDAQCLVCSLQLCEQISTSNQGILLFECGHVFHKHCVPEGACVVCFQRNLTTIGRKIL